MRTLTAALLLLLVAFAGCTDDAGIEYTDNEDSSNAGSSGDADDGTGGSASGPVEYDEVDVLFHLSSDGLSGGVPADGTLPLVGVDSMFGASDIAEAEYATGVFGIPMRIPKQTVTADVWLQTDAIGIGNPEFDLAFWVGTTRGELAFNFASLGVLQPGEPQQVSVTLDIIHDMVLPAGESITARVLGMYQPDGQADIVIGADTPSGFTITLEPQGTAVTSKTSENILGEYAQMTGGTFANCDEGPLRHPFTVPADATAIDILMTGANTIPGAPADIDMDLYDGDTHIWHAGSPYTSEEIFLAGSALEPYLGKELAVVGSVCLGPAVDYSVTVLSDVPASETP